jgi:hypothetical protein
MLIPYQLPQFGILIIPQMVCKKREENKIKGENKGKNFSECPFLLQLRNCHNDFFK